MVLYAGPPFNPYIILAPWADDPRTRFFYCTTGNFDAFLELFG